MSRNLLILTLLLVLGAAAGAAADLDDDAPGSAVFLPFFLSPGAPSCPPAGAQGFSIPEDPRVSVLVDRAMRMERSGRYDRAARAYLAAFNRSPGGDAAPFLLFRYSCLERRAGESIRFLRRILAEHPGFALLDAVRFELGKRLYLLGRYPPALEALREIEEEGGSPRVAAAARALRGVIAREQGDPERALNELSSAVSLLAGEDPSRVPTRDSGDRPGMTGEGVEPGDGERGHRGALFTRLYLEAARSMDPGSPRLHALLLGIAGTAPGDLVRAEALFMLGESHRREGRASSAAGAFRLLVEEYPSSPFAAPAEQALAQLGGIEPENPRLLFEPGLLDGKVGIVVQEGEGGGMFAVQLGSFTLRENAESLAARLEERGFPAFITETKIDERTYYRVRVGGYESREEAQQVRGRLASSGYQGYVVTRH